MTYTFVTYPRHAVGLTVHLAAILPAAFLATLQFVPATRTRWPAVHRALGYASLALSLPGIVSTVVIADLAHGGDMSIRSSCAALAAAAAGALARGWWVKVRRGRIDLHRAWMLRGWAYLGCIITMRPITLLSAALVGRPAVSRALYGPLPCKLLLFMFERAPPNANLTAEENVYALHPACRPGVPNEAGMSLTRADLLAVRREGRPDMFEAGVRMTFGMALWTAFVVHAALVEWYLAATEKEAKRLRAASGKYRESLGLEKEVDPDGKVKAT